MSKKKKKSLLDSKFYRVYFTCLAAAAVLILVGTVWLMGILRDVESAVDLIVETIASLTGKETFIPGID